MKSKKFLWAGITALLLAPACRAQNSLAEKLGYPKDARLLIIHADDLAVSHAEDSATILAWEKGAISSASIMVPCPWFSEIAAYAKNHPQFDWGIHITLNAEWKYYRWAGVSPSNEIQSLLTKDGYLPGSVEEVVANAKPAEVEKETRAQIDKALAAGIRLTHLDGHMGAIMSTPEFVSIYQKLGKEYGLPVFLPMNEMKGRSAEFRKAIDTTPLFIVNKLYIAYPGIPNDKWNDFYNEVLKSMEPGLNEIIVHLALDNEESRAINADHPDYGAAWRQRDLDYVLSAGMKENLKKEKIYLVSWGDIQKVVYKK